MSASLIRDILNACDQEDSMRYQDPPIEVRNDVKRPFYFIRPRVRVINAEGKVVPKRKPYRLGFCDETTMRKAREAKQQIMAPINAGRELLLSQIPFPALLGKYVAVHVPTLGPAAQLTYERHIRLHIRPAFEKCRMCDIDKLAVQEWLNAKAKANLGHETLKDLRKVLHHVFSWAEDNKLWEGTNPCQKVKVGGAQRPSTKLLPAQESLCVFLGALRDTSLISAEGARLIVLIAVASGMRISEILGLQVQDIDRIRETVKIERSWARGNVGPTKTKDSRRIRQIPGLAADLCLYARRNNKACQDYIFSGECGRPPDDRDLQQHVFRPAAERVRIYSPGFGMHRFRHLNISWRQEVGAHPLEAMKAAGHAQVSTTWRYTQTDEERERAHVRAILERLQGKAEGAVQ